MVEGDLVDLTLPSLLHALARERSTAVLRRQRGTVHGTASTFFRGSREREEWRATFGVFVEGLSAAAQDIAAGAAVLNPR
jgi:hypothetical protein